MSDLIEEVQPAFRRLSVDDRVFWSPSLAGELQTGPPETLEARTAIATLTGLVRCATLALEANRLAISYRDYRVGATAIACNFETGEMGYIDGFNVKEAPGACKFNIHAEQMAIAKARYRGLNRIIGIAVYADPNDEDANPNHLPTLPPCSRCVGMFETADEVDSRTLVLCTNPDFTLCQLYTVGHLKNATENPKLVTNPFSLETKDDIEHYDREIKPRLGLPVMELYGHTADS